MKITENYMEKVYAGWLGKIIGIRLGAPIEGWTYQRIRDVFGAISGYSDERSPGRGSSGADLLSVSVKFGGIVSVDL